MTTFALVHGSWHRGSCWWPTAELLRAAGHHVVAPDLPCEDPGAGLEEYTAAVVRAIADTRPSDDVVVVGHSLGGLTAPLVAEHTSVRELVYLCALVPLPGASVSDDLYSRDDTFAPSWSTLSSRLVVHDDGSTSWPVDAAIEAMYHDCDPELARTAAQTLRRQVRTIAHQPSPLRAYPGVPSRAIVCRHDRILNAEACARHAAERFDAEVTWLDGGHSPMLAQPAALVDALLAG